MQYCREYYEMKNSARQVVSQVVVEEAEPVFDLVGVAEAEGWDQTELMFFVFEYGVENGVSFCREYYEMKSRQEVRQAVCPEPTKEAKIQFLFRGSGVLEVQKVDGGLTLEEWFAGREGGILGSGADGYFTTLGGKVLNPRVEVSGLGLGGLQEVVFHGSGVGGKFLPEVVGGGGGEAVGRGGGTGGRYLLVPLLLKGNRWFLLYRR